MNTGKIALFAGLLLAAGVANARAAPPVANYTFSGDLQLGAPGFWDYLTFDPLGKRIYAAHYDKISVIDSTTMKPIGSVGPVGDAHGVAIVSALGKGYAVSGEEGVVEVFDLNDLHITGKIKVGDDADGALFEPRTGKVLVVAGDAKTLSVIDPKTDTVKSIPLPDKPEYLAVDDTGHAYVNLSTQGAIAKIDIASGTTAAVWPLVGCKGPHGLAYEPVSQRLFSGCSNGVLVVVDAHDGRNIAAVPIGPMSDGVVVDVQRRLVFSASALGTLSVVHEEQDGSVKLVRTIPTFFGGRNLTIDPASGALFVSHGAMKLEPRTGGVLDLRFSWDGLDVARFDPQN